MYIAIARGGLGDLNTVALAMQQQEGYYPGSLAYINNNPGNLMPAGQPGCSPGAGGFCSFPSYADGFQALENQITLDASRGLSIAQFTAKYAPASAGNDPTTYANNIAAAVGLSPGDSLTDAISNAGGVSSMLSAGGFDISALTDWFNSLDFSSFPSNWATWAAVGGLALLAVWVLA